MNTQKLVGSALAITALAVVGMGSARADINPVSPGTPNITTSGSNFLYTYAVEVSSTETLITKNYFTFFDVAGLVASSAFAPTDYTVAYNLTGPVATGSKSSSPTTDAPGLMNVTFTYTGTTSVPGLPTGIGNFGFMSIYGTAGTEDSFSGVALKTGTTSLNSNATTYFGPTAPTTVPEPASVIPFALGGLGLLGLIARKTRRTSGAAA